MGEKKRGKPHSKEVVKRGKVRATKNKNETRRVGGGSIEIINGRAKLCEGKEEKGKVGKLPV